MRRSVARLPRTPRRTVAASVVQQAAYRTPDEELDRVLASLGASLWDMEHACIDAPHGLLAQDGESVRAVPDTGHAPGGPFDMRNWLPEPGTGVRRLAPVLRETAQGHRGCDHAAAGTWGLWCKSGRMPYQIHEAHFAVAVVVAAREAAEGIAFQASKAQHRGTCELALHGGRPQARWIDADGLPVVLTADAALSPGAPSVISLTSSSGRQTLRVDGLEVRSRQAVFAPTPVSQLLIGWGFRNYLPQANLQGQVHAVATGRGAPDPLELVLLERRLGRLAGIEL